MRHLGYDIVVIGAGVAGTAAAIEAARRGARVAVVDADAEPGGTARTAGGGTCIPDTPLQRELGLSDSVELALQDWMSWGGPDADISWAERYLKAASSDIYFRLERLGVRWNAVRPQEGNSVARWHAPDGGGRAVMSALAAEADRSGVHWQLSTRVDRLEADGGDVTGVAATDADGRMLIRARSVLVATGGFANDAELVHAHGTVPAGTRVILGGGSGARGLGHRMLEQVGAAFVNMDVIWMYPFATPDALSHQADRGVAVRGMDGDIWVNGSGVRFHDESRRGGRSGTTALLAQPGATCWSIIDADIAERLVVADPTYRRGVEPHRERIRQLLDRSPFVHRGESIRQLAQRVGIDPDALRATVDEHNGSRRSPSGTDPAFGRDVAGLRPLDRPPYFAVQLFPLARKNLGGVRTDACCRVVRPNGEAINGLFAAGEVAGMAGGHVNGQAALEGTMLGPSLFSGLIAGAAM